MSQIMCPINLLPYIEFSAFGVIGLSFLLVVMWMMSSMSNSIWVLTLVQLDMHKTLIRHDAQVRGVNPSAGNDDTDAHNKARQEYEAILETISNTASLVKERIRVPRSSRFSIFG